MISYIIIVHYFADKNALAKSSDNNELEKDKCDTLREANEEEPVAGPSNLTPRVENTNEYRLNDDSDDDVDTHIYNDSMPIAENINEYAFDSDWESDCDVNESLALLSEKYLGTSKTNPALTYMLEYSGLSQKQIVHLLKHNKDEGHENASKYVKAPEKNTCERSVENEKMANDEAKLELSENSEKASKFIHVQNIQDACMTNDDETKEVDLISSKQKSDIEIEPSPKDTEMSDVAVTSNTLNLNDETTLEKQAASSSIAKFSDGTQMDSSDSDSDDFIEIQDVPIPPDAEVPRNIVRKENIEITFKTDEKPEQDMFADIFEEANKNGVIPIINPLEQSLSDTRGEHKTLLISKDSDNLKSNSLDTIPEEPEAGETKVQSLEDILLVNNAANDEDKIHNSQNSNERVEWNKTSSDNLTRNSFNECMQEKPTLPANEEDLIELKVH